MGSLLLSISKIGVTHALVQSFGACTLLSDFWKITARSGAISLHRFFKTTGFMESCPDALFGFNFCRSLGKSVTEIVMSAINGNLLCKSVGIEWKVGRV